MKPLGKRIAVLGVTGFIGAPLAVELAKANDVVGIGKAASLLVGRELEQAGVSLLERDVVRDGLRGVPSDFDYVYSELAVTRAAAERNPDDAISVNIVFVKELLEHFRRASGIVIGSTGNVYVPSVEPLSETATIGPTDVYGLTKACGDLFVEYYGAALEVPTCILRYFFPYGPNDRKLKPLLDAIVAGLEVPVNPAARVNPIYITDVVEATISAIACCRIPTEVINVGGSETVTWKHMADLIGAVMGRVPLFSNTREESDTGGHRVSDGRRQLANLPPPRMDLEAGLAEVVRCEQG